MSALQRSSADRQASLIDLGQCRPGVGYWYSARHLQSRIASSLAEELVRTPAVLRLRGISFLGAIDYSLGGERPRYLSTRFDHSVGVARLASLACDLLDATHEERELCVAAALLHDVGHGPLSHSLEQCFEGQFGINHHRRTQDVLRGPLEPLLDAAGVDVDALIMLMSGHGSHRLSFLFASPINLDTIEGITRAASYLPRLRDGGFADAVVRSLCAVMTGQPTGAHLMELDRFWSLKGLIYTQLVRGPLGVASDHVSQAYFASRPHCFEAAHFQSTDAELALAFPDLFERLHQLGASAREVRRQTVHYTRRVFSINADGAPADFDEPGTFLSSRYRQNKIAATVDVDLPEEESITEEEATHERFGGSKAVQQ